jgi:hypothetical protein
VATDWTSLALPAEAADILGRAPSVVVPRNVEELAAMAVGDGVFEVAFDVPGRGRVVEAVAARVRNGVSANYILVIYLAPPFRHTLWDGKQVVVITTAPTTGCTSSSRYNLYPGPARRRASTASCSTSARRRAG